MHYACVFLQTISAKTGLLCLSHPLCLACVASTHYFGYQTLNRIADYTIGPVLHILAAHFSRPGLEKFARLTDQLEQRDPSLFPVIPLVTMEKLLRKAPPEIDGYANSVQNIVLSLEEREIRRGRSTNEADSCFTEEIIRCKDQIVFKDWMSIVGEYYLYIDHSTELTNSLVATVMSAGIRGPVPELMAPRELNSLNGFAFPLDGYRGCVKGVSENGLSYTTKRDIAVDTLSRFFEEERGGTPVVNRASFSIDDIVAYKDIRGECELLVYSANVLETCEVEIDPLF